MRRIISPVYTLTEIPKIHKKLFAESFFLNDRWCCCILSTIFSRDHLREKKNTHVNSDVAVLNIWIIPGSYRSVDSRYVITRISHCRNHAIESHISSNRLLELHSRSV